MTRSGCLPDDNIYLTAILNISEIQSGWAVLPGAADCKGRLEISI
ncbi:hypothetical protein C5S39_08915 [Candidatus Methanophagaceae archaeon]|nr:hypothetical protein C5S39_08915 [Methanophagales archaeon]